MSGAPAVLYGPGELLKASTGLYAKRPDPRFDILIDVARLLRQDMCRTRDLLRILIADRRAFIVEERRGEHYEVVFRASYSDDNSSLTFHENMEGGWRNSLQKWYDDEFPLNPESH
jgi:hypothetical protein